MDIDQVNYFYELRKEIDAIKKLLVKIDGRIDMCMRDDKYYPVFATDKECNCHLNKSGASTGGWDCPVHGHCF